MSYIAKKGDLVVYTGETKYARDVLTMDIMKKQLIIWDTYLVDGIRESGIYKGYYIIGNAYYPPKSFIKNHDKISMAKKYNLR